MNVLTHFLDWFFDRPASYRVIYPNDEGKTQRLPLSMAKSLQKRYGGKIIYSPPEKESNNEH